MHIGMLCHNYPPHPGGLEVMVQSLSRGLAQRHQVTVVTSGWNGTYGVTVEDGVSVHRIPAVHVTEDWGVPYPVPVGLGVAKAVAALRSADVLHAHGALYPTSMLAAGLAKRGNVPLVLTEHVGFVEYRRAALNTVQRTAWTTIGNTVVRATDVLATYNQRVKQWLEARYPGRSVEYVGNGVDAAMFRPRNTQERRSLRARFGLPPNKPVALYAGRASEKKNLDVVLAIPRDSFHLVVCGAQRNLKMDNLTDLGILPHREMPELFACADMMVHASTGEGFPLAIQEGISSGLPLVLLWDDGYGGWLEKDAVVACESLDDLGTQLQALAKNGEQRKVLSKRARAWAEARWSWDATVKAYESLYEQELRRTTRAA